MVVKSKHTGESWVVIANRERWERRREEAKARRLELLKVRADYYARISHDYDNDLI
jgi:hypothetical protein